MVSNIHSSYAEPTAGPHNAISLSFEDILALDIRKR